MARTGHSVTILTTTGDIVPNAPIEIRLYSTGLLANIFEQNGTPITQSGATADSNGIFRFWAEPNEYFARHGGVDVPVTVGLGSSEINRLNPRTLADWQSDTTALVGDVVTTRERTAGKLGGMTGVVIAGTATANGGNIVAHDTLDLSWSMQLDRDGAKNASSWGIIPDFDGTTGTDNAARIELAMSHVSELLLDRVGRYGHTGIVTPNGVFLRGTGVSSTSLEMLPNPTKIAILHSHDGQTLKIRDLTIDGSVTQGPAQGGLFIEGVYCNLGNLDIDDAIIRRVSSYALRTGNIELNFDINKKAGFVRIGGNVLIDQLGAAEGLYDCARIERTERLVVGDGARFHGGLSSLRIQYYVDSIVVGDIITKNNWGDVGITVALCSDFSINGSNNSGHARHGIELDGVRRGAVNGCTNHGNLIDGIVVAEYTAPSGASFEGYLDGELIQAGDLVYPEDVYIGGGSQFFNNGQFGVRVSRPNGVTFGDIKISENCTTNTPFVDAAIFVTQGATVGGKDVQDVTFTDAVSVINNANQIKVMNINDYKVGAERSIKFYSRGISGGNGERFQFPVTGTLNLNRDPFLVGEADISGTGVSSYDAQSVTGAAYIMDDTSTGGDLNTILRLPSKLRFSTALIAIWHRSDAGTSTLNIAVNLYNGGTFVETALSTSVTSKTNYTEFKSLVSPSSQSVDFDEVRIDLKTSITEISKLYINRIDAFTKF